MRMPPPDDLSFSDADIAAIPHEYAFDPTCGMRIAQLCEMTHPGTEPADFVDFWQETYARVRLADSVICLEPSFTPREAPEGIVAWDVAYTAWGGVRTHAYLHEPATGPSRGLVVHGHGYGGPAAPMADYARRGYASLQVHQRGFGASQVQGLPHNNSLRHVLHGIADRETYVFRGCVAEIWQGASLLLHRHPGLRDYLFYEGGSFGGGIGALVLPWDKRIKAGLLRVPSFGHYPIRLAHRCVGSGEAVRRHQARLPALLDTLPYYDTATAATYITCPVHTVVAAFDPAVIPPGQFAVANSIGSAGSRRVIIPADHFEPGPVLWPPAAREALEAERRAFMDSYAKPL